MPMTVAMTISQMRYSATSQVPASRRASARRVRPEFIASSLTAVDFSWLHLPGLS